MSALDAFRTRRTLAVLNVAGVALALTALTALGFGAFAKELEQVVRGILPTLAIGTLWAWLLRSPKKVGSLRLGWALSPVLAALNGGLSGAVVFEGWPGFAAGISVGVIVWMPALILTLFLFGLPLARAERLAKDGLDGAERGEQVVGVTVSILGLLAVLLASTSVQPKFLPALVAGALAIVCGVSSALLASQRRRTRGKFVAEVEAGRVANFRVDPTPEGKALIRVDARGDTYRVMDYEEEIAVLSERGTVRRGLSKLGER